MKAKTLKGIAKEKGNLEELEALGYHIERKQPWHWRITKPDYDVAVDVWPTKSKIWVVGSSGSAQVYQDLLEKIQIIFEKYMP